MTEVIDARSNGTSLRSTLQLVVSESAATALAERQDDTTRAIRVMLRLGQDAPEHRKILALLYSLTVATSLTLSQCRQLGYCDKLLGSLERLTSFSESTQTYLGWIDRLASSGDTDAMVVKLCDIYESLEPASSESGPSVDKQLAKREFHARVLLEAVLAVKELQKLRSGRISEAEVTAVLCQAAATKRPTTLGA